MATTTTLPRPIRRLRTTVLTAREVTDDETLHPGVVVWLAERRLDESERSRFDVAARHADATRRAAMRRHPSARPAPLRAV